MGEKTRIPNKNSDNNKPKDSDVQNPTEDLNLSNINDVDVSIEEFESLNNQLDELSSALDDIESKNDNIHAQLLELLQANRVIRQQIRDANLSVAGTEAEESQ